MKRTVLLLASTSLALLLSCVVVLFGVEEPAGAAFSGRNNGKIAFIVSAYNGPGTFIYAMNADGSDKQELISQYDVDDPENPAWSKDGSKIAFTERNPSSSTDSDVTVLDLASYRWTFLTKQYYGETTQERQPAWSPGGSSVAFAATKVGNQDIYTTPTGTNYGTPTRVTTSPLKEYDPALSGSNRLAYTVLEQDSATGTSDTEIYAGQATPLTSNAYDDAEADWSPDGSKIAFSSNRDGNSEIYTMNADGSDQTRITNNSWYDGDPVWSPDGTKIAFVADRGDVTGRDIYTMNVDGSGEQQLTYWYGSEKDPDWQQDSTSPGLVGSLTAGAGDQQTLLSWTNPRAADFALTRILRSKTAFATSPSQTEGQTQVYEGSETSHTDKNLTNGTTYYTAFTKDVAANWSGPAQASGTNAPAKPTTLTFSTSETLVPYNGETRLSGTLSTSSGVVPEEKTVAIQRSTDGGKSWKSGESAAYNTSTGEYEATVSLTRNTIFRLRFNGDPFYRASSSSQKLVKAHAYLSQPVTPDTVRKNTSFTTDGFLEPLHSGSTPLYFYHYKGGRYVLYERPTAKNAAYDEATTKYTLRYQLPYAGKWMVKALHSDASHAKTWSPAREFVVSR